MTIWTTDLQTQRENGTMLTDQPDITIKLRKRADGTWHHDMLPAEPLAEHTTNWLTLRLLDMCERLQSGACATTREVSERMGG